MRVYFYEDEYDSSRYFASFKEAKEFYVKNCGELMEPIHAQIRLFVIPPSRTEVFKFFNEDEDAQKCTKRWVSTEEQTTRCFDPADPTTSIRWM